MKVYIGPWSKHRWWHIWTGHTHKRITYVKIDREDTWSMDHTLSHIILPMLKQLKETMHGYPSELTEKEWDDILGEMIWAFEQKCRDDWMEDYDYTYNREAAVKHQERMTNGFRLFGKYYENLWD